MTNKHLTPEQKSNIYKIDHPNWSGQQATNIGEKEPTIFRSKDGLLITRRIGDLSDESNTEYYFPATNVVRALSKAELSWINEGAAQGFEIPDSLKSELIPGNGWKFPDIPESPDTSRIRTRTLVLNPTEQCNIRCTYCYYGGAYNNTRSHRTLAPSDDSLAKAIKSFITGEQRLLEDQQAIYFFGGEPLMGFKKSKQLWI